MKKDSYKKELSIAATQKRRGENNNSKDTRKIQSWLCLYALQHPASGCATTVDGDFGPATERAVRNFQEATGLSTTGTVTQKVFGELSKGMKNAFETPLTASGMREALVEAAGLHLANHPQELQIQGEWNSGPWVRAYMDGKDGSPWFWCMGFVQTLLDQAASHLNKNFKSLMPLTYSCDVAGSTALQKGLLTRYTKLREEPKMIQTGDVFLIQKHKMDWVHTGIVLERIGDVIETVEGNTNEAGSRNGIAVMRRMRNFRKSKIDIFHIDPLVE